MAQHSDGTGRWARGDTVHDNEDDEIDLQLHKAHSARMYDYYLGGMTNFAADREAAGQAIAVFPSARIAARANRAFMHRATRLLADRGIAQFLDIGTGIPTSPNLHEVAQGINSQARVLYTDNDPIVLAHAQALLLSSREGLTSYLQADVTDPAAILSSRELEQTIDLTAPVALSLIALLHFVPDDHGACRIVDQLKDALSPGSALVISHGTPDFGPADAERITQVYAAAGTEVRMRTREQIERFFDGWDLLDPGVSPTHRWRPEGAAEQEITDAQVSAYAAVAVKR
ncbi:SAM-dependent methyltransferase [Streptomyces sp. FH025]|uniref:SAM-dependent methyltransferase n=1 Tax=Streptomyces sp. FH025 TaxID=2815937 RepID=UPI001A9F8B7B|nr:SAM-dependent methyltransferase [Streptomyces sp. FH025]MBO1418022.1 SAM-dependent methyltransferase [Streptomyces sp. FH025]